METLGCFALLGWHIFYQWVTWPSFSMEVMAARLHRHKKRLLEKMAFIGGYVSGFLGSGLWVLGTELVSSTSVVYMFNS